LKAALLRHGPDRGTPRIGRLAGLAVLRGKLDALEIKSEKRDGGTFLKDPWGIGLTLSA
jgi:catechol 2,3-dioxygenase